MRHFTVIILAAASILFAIQVQGQSKAIGLNEYALQKYVDNTAFYTRKELSDNRVEIGKRNVKWHMLMYGMWPRTRETAACRGDEYNLFNHTDECLYEMLEACKFSSGTVAQFLYTRMLQTNQTDEPLIKRLTAASEKCSQIRDQEYGLKQATIEEFLEDGGEREKAYINVIRSVDQAIKSGYVPPSVARYFHKSSMHDYLNMKEQRFIVWMGYIKGVFIGLDRTLNNKELLEYFPSLPTFDPMRYKHINQPKVTPREG